MGIGKGTGRGGKREGAGAKAVDGAVVTTIVSASIDAASVRLISEYGGDKNTSLAIRRICADLIRYRSGSPAMKSISKTGEPKKPPVRIEVPERGPDGRRYSITKHLQLQAEADEQYTQAMQKWRKENPGT